MTHRYVLTVKIGDSREVAVYGKTKKGRRRFTPSPLCPVTWES